jgi:hypothetical protein
MKLGLVKSVTDGKRTLEHYRHLNVAGFPVETFDLIETREDGGKLIKPMFPPMKVNDFDRSTPIGLATDYSEEEMLQVLKDVS